MREILFRGKKKGNVDWLYGHLTEHKGVAQIWVGSDNGQWNYIVDLETVGQFTGLTDKNGKKIFEGDILKTEDVVHNGEIQIRGEVFRVEMLKGSWMVIATDTEWDFLYTNTRSTVVIGNIHDNPELLEPPKGD